MDRKAQLTLYVQHLLIKYGYYNRSLVSLTELLKILEMPIVVQPNQIQQNTINGIIKVIENHKQKVIEHIHNSQHEGIGAETKEFLITIVRDVLVYLNQNQPADRPSFCQATIPYSQSMAMPPYQPMNQMGFNSPPMIQKESDYTIRLMEQQIRMQQQQYMMYLYGGYNMIPSYPHQQYSQPPLQPSPYPNFHQQNNYQINNVPPNAPTSGFKQPINTPINTKPQNQNVKKKNSKQKNFNYVTYQIKDKKQINLIDEEPEIKQKQMNSPNYKLLSKNDRDERKILSQQISRSIMNKKTIEKTNVEPNKQYLKCACKGLFESEQFFSCITCQQKFHFICLSEPLRKAKSGEQLECHHCRLKAFDPLNRVKEVIGEHYINNLNDIKFQIQYNLSSMGNLCKHKGSKYEIEMRCIKIQIGSENNDITWPDQCIIRLNGERIIEIPALQTNSSLKKRKDYSILITQNIFGKNYDANCDKLDKTKISLEVKHLTKEEMCNKKIKNNHTFALAIYLIEKLNIDQLYSKIVNDESSLKHPKYIESLLNTDENEVQIQKISITLFDPYTRDLIKTPVRGLKCKHGQCFDLKTFISFMMNARNRAWKCPICSKDSKKFIIDSEVDQILKRVRQTGSVPSEVEFLKDGTIVMKIDNNSDSEGESKNKSEISKTKKIKKAQKSDRNISSKEQQKQLPSKEQIKQKKQNSEENIYINENKFQIVQKPKLNEDIQVQKINIDNNADPQQNSKNK